MSDTYVSGEQEFFYLGKIRWIACPDQRLRSAGFLRLTQHVMYKAGMTEGLEMGGCGAPIIATRNDGSRGVLGFHHYTEVV